MKMENQVSKIGPAFVRKTKVVIKTAKKLGLEIEKIKVLEVKPEDVCGIPVRDQDVFAQAWMNHVFVHIKHGDDEHRAWLKDKCQGLVKTLARRLQRQGLEITQETDQNGKHRDSDLQTDP